MEKGHLPDRSAGGGAVDEASALLARTVCGSSLVKTAVHGQDPNWGRLRQRTPCAFDPEGVAWMAPPVGGSGNMVA